MTPALAVPLPQPRPSSMERQSRSADNSAPVIDVPMPLPRPKQNGGAPADASTPTPEPAIETACTALEASGEVVFERLTKIDDGQCGTATPISLVAFAPKDGPRVTLEMPVTVTCAVAAASLDWLKTALQPAAIRHYGEAITSLRRTGGYECRGRNRVAGAKLSEHGRANAIDIGGFQRASGKTVFVESQNDKDKLFLGEIRKAACGPFTTVLGPGVVAHAEHFHFDLAKRGKHGRSLYCR